MPAKGSRPSTIPRGTIGRICGSACVAEEALRGHTERIKRLTPPPPPLSPTFERILTIGGLPFLIVRLFWYNLREVRFWWPLVLPLLAWTAWRTYHRERAQSVQHDRTAQSRA
ncbi:MAG: hypothetical protein J7463_10950 [Roseiflexus sp.]|nr:hypothetical protein [Roseiflexus sp.]MBO9334132.1 hypothetical protein [Roseiflexus sp.]MBO9365412.1 hypothetical protein [Roseiflexus sp.]MBO9382194.1 hypothetical protein [Roseiflexus sp.]MBO9389827.1 hypothetical protein [Roseiflexus sp.]